MIMGAWRCFQMKRLNSSRVTLAHVASERQSWWFCKLDHDKVGFSTSSWHQLPGYQSNPYFSHLSQLSLHWFVCAPCSVILLHTVWLRVTSQGSQQLCQTSQPRQFPIFYLYMEFGYWLHFNPFYFPLLLFHSLEKQITNYNFKVKFTSLFLPPLVRGSACM